MFVQQTGIATRSFADEVNRPATDNVLFAHPEDFELHLIGTFDEESGEVESVRPTRCLVRGQDVSKAQGA